MNSCVKLHCKSDNKITGASPSSPIGLQKSIMGKGDFHDCPLKDVPHASMADLELLKGMFSRGTKKSHIGVQGFFEVPFSSTDS